MKPAIRLLLTLLTILSCATIAGAAVQEAHVGVDSEKACVLEGESHFPASLVAPRSVDNLIGRRGGQLYGRERLDQLQAYLGRRGVDLKIGRANSFQVFEGAKRPVLTLRRNPTEYEVWHELSHYLHYRKVGASAYQSLTRRVGMNIPESEVFRTLAPRWNRLNPSEQRHAIEYLRDDWGMEIPWHLIEP